MVLKSQVEERCKKDTLQGKNPLQNPILTHYPTICVTSADQVKSDE